MENLKLDDFTRYSFLSNLEFSPDGKHACFVVHKADVDENGYSSNLWLYSSDQNSCRQLTAFDKEKGFIWLSDSRHILFPGMRNPKDKDKVSEGEDLTVFYKIDIHGGEAKEAFRLPLAVKQIRQVDDNTFLFTATFNPDRPCLEGMSDEERAKELKRRKEDKMCQVVEEIPFWSNGAGFISKNRNRLCLYDAAAGKWEVLSEDSLQVQNFRLNPARTQAVIIGQAYEGKMERENALYIADIKAKKVRRLTQPEKFAWSDAHFFGEQLLCLGRDMQQYGLNQNPVFYLVEPETGERRLLTPDFDRSTWNSVGSDCRLGGGDPARIDGQYLYFITTEDYSSYINRIDINGDIEKVTTAGGSVDSYDVRDGRVLFVGMRDLRLQELYSLEESGERKITSFNDWVHNERKISPPEHLSVETAPGVIIDGWVIKPVDYQEGNRYPAILDIHGGPKTVYGETFFHEMQYWANEGYFVFFCNPRGSDGKGNKFADIRGKYGTIDYQDIMAFTDAVLKQYPAIDGQRLGVTGGSYGGFMTNWIIGHTDRFRAAASQRSIANWVSMGYTTDIGYYFEPDQMGADPWTDIDKVWEQSPLKYADRVKTPTLFIHSDEDYRCWVPEALQMFTALKNFGVESRLCLFKGENHELSRSGKPKPRIRRLKEITDWFNRYLRGRFSVE